MILKDEEKIILEMKGSDVKKLQNFQNRLQRKKFVKQMQNFMMEELLNPVNGGAGSGSSNT